MRVRFPNLTDIKVPEDLMMVDEALDEIGKRRFPTSWGVVTPIDELPIERCEDGFTQPIIREGRIFYESIACTLLGYTADYALYSHLHKQFFVVRQIFTVAAEKPRFRLLYLHPTRGIFQNPMAKGMATFHQRMITTFGMVLPPDANDNTNPVLVLVERKPFMKWVVGVSDILEDSDREIIVGGRIPASVFEAVLDMMRGKQLKLKKEWLWEIFVSAAADNGRILSENYFHENIWRSKTGVVPDDLKLRGPPTQKQLTALEAHKAEAVSAAKCAFQAADNRKPPT